MSLRILLVDDNPDILRTYTKALRREIVPRPWNTNLFGSGTAAIDVISADTSALAIKKLREESFDILVVDLKIPGPSGEEVGGLELISESISLDALRPVIAVTGYGTIELARRTLTQGVFDFIEKSETAIKDLIKAVQRAIDSHDEKMLRSGIHSRR
jgi:DNA-binding NtrC family response regulator